MMPTKRCVAILAMILGTGTPADGQVITEADYARAEAVHEANAPKLVFRNRPAYRWSNDAKTLDYTINDRDGPKHFRIDATTGARTEVAPDAPSASAGESLVSPDGAKALFTRENNLWVRDQHGERQLTRDGVEHYGYGTLPDFFYRTIARKKGQLKLAPAGVTWSPDGKTLFGQRFDERAVGSYPFIEWNPAGSHRPQAYDVRLALMGDAEQPKPRPFLIDIGTGVVRDVAGPAEWQLETNSTMWAADGKRAWLIATTKDDRGGALFELDVDRAALRKAIEERQKGYVDFNAASRYNQPNVRVLANGREAIWPSDRDGWANLYLYDLKSGGVKRQLTRGPGAVLDILAIDEGKRRLYFSAAGRNPNADPYQRQLYAVSLKGGPVMALTEDDHDHELAGPIAPLFKIFFRTPPGVGAISPDFRHFVDVSSTVSDPPVTRLRSLDTGKVIAELDRADASPLTALGWRAPERFKVKAADGVTDIWGAVYLPPGYDPSRRYPVIDALYAGPQVSTAPRNFNEASGARAQMFGRNSLAALGFVVVTIDARGTPGRSRDFHDVSYGNFADPQLDDHVAALRQLAKRYPGLDLSRVGTYGHSLGGYVSARALLRYPDFYKVAVSSAGPHDWESFNDNMAGVFGLPDYGSGMRQRPEPLAVPSNIITLDNTSLAARLKGKLLLAFGDIVENAPPGNTMAMIAALTKAGKRYDLIYLPSTTHSYGGLDYFGLRTWDYFAEHLLGAAPPDYALKTSR